MMLDRLPVIDRIRYRSGHGLPDMPLGERRALEGGWIAGQVASPPPEIDEGFGDPKVAVHSELQAELYCRAQEAARRLAMPAMETTIADPRP